MNKKQATIFRIRSYPPRSALLASGSAGLDAACPRSRIAPHPGKDGSSRRRCRFVRRLNFVFRLAHNLCIARPVIRQRFRLSRLPSTTSARNRQESAASRPAERLCARGTVLENVRGLASVRMPPARCCPENEAERRRCRERPPGARKRGNSYEARHGDHKAIQTG